jgi:integrase
MACIRQRGKNSWQIIVSCGYDATGKKLSETKTVKKPSGMTDRQWEKELQKIALEFEIQIEKGEYYEPSKITITEFIDKWLEQHGKNLEIKTLYRYQSLLNGRVKTALGHLKLDQIKPLHLLDFYRNLQESGIREDGKKGGLSNKTIQHYHRVLSVMFENAVKWGMMKENPCTKVSPPKVERKEMLCLDEEGIGKLMSCLEKENIKYQAIIELFLVTGCRRGEIAALQWNNIDLDKGIIHIKQAAVYTPSTGIVVKQPKTLSSIRKIKLPTSTVELLRDYRKYWLTEKIKVGDLWQKEEKEKLGANWQDPEWVFATWNGYIMHPDSFTDIFKKFIHKYSLPDIRLHDLRHTSATLLINAGLNVRAVAQRLGHANANVTLAIYTHALQSVDEAAANVMESYVKEQKSIQSNKV